MQEKAKKIADLLKVLANENRLIILCALKEKALTVNEIHSYIPTITQSALSQHLKLLYSNAILDYEKKGLNVFYYISDPRVNEILLVLKKYYCT